METRTRNSRLIELGPDGWTRHNGDLVRLPVVVMETEVGYLAMSATTPVVQASGVTKDEAMVAITAALAEAIKAADSKAARPHSVSDVPFGAKWVFVNIADPA